MKYYFKRNHLMGRYESWIEPTSYEIALLTKIAFL